MLVCVSKCDVNKLMTSIIFHFQLWAYSNMYELYIPYMKCVFFTYRFKMTKNGVLTCSNKKQILNKHDQYTYSLQNSLFLVARKEQFFFKITWLFQQGIWSVKRKCRQTTVNYGQKFATPGLSKPGFFLNSSTKTVFRF